MLATVFADQVFSGYVPIFQSKSHNTSKMAAANMNYLDDSDEDLDDSIVKILGQKQLRSYGDFIDKHSAKLRSIELKLDDTISEFWDITLDPIQLRFLPYEQATFIDLIKTKNLAYDKINVVLASLCAELRFLCREAKLKFYNQLLLYGDGMSNSDDYHAADALGSFMPVIRDLNIYVIRCNDVVKNVVQQLSQLYSSKQEVPIQEVHLHIVFQCLGELLVAMITLDEIIQNQTTLRNHWTIYRRLLKSALHDAACLGSAPEKLKALSRITSDTEHSFLQGCIFAGCLNQEFDNPRLYGSISKNTSLHEEFTTILRQWMSAIDPRLGEPVEMNKRHEYLSIVAIMILQSYLFRNTNVDKKLFRQIWDVHKRVPCIHLHGNVVCLVDQIFVTHIGSVVSASIDKKTQDAPKTSRNTYLRHRVANIGKDTQSVYQQLASWLVRMETSFHQMTDKLQDDLNKQCSMLIQGLYFAWYISHEIHTLTNLHVVLNKAMSKATVLQLCRSIEMLKSIEATYHRHTFAVSEAIVHIVQHLNYVGLVSVVAAKKRLISDKRNDRRNADILAALQALEIALNGPGTKERRLVADLATAFCGQTRYFKDDEFSSLHAVLRKLNRICDLHERLREACDTSTLYWHEVFFPIFVGEVYSTGIGVQRIGYLLFAMRDCGPMLQSAKHTSTLLDDFKTRVMATFEQKLLTPLCKDIETDLRLQIHEHLNVNTPNPFTAPVKDNRHLLDTTPLRFFDTVVNIRRHVEHHLDATFYNLTTVALHDWRTYDEMRTMAKHKYGLHTVECHLPSQTLEQGLDVLEIMRNIRFFVSRYLYNLNNQIFIQRTSNNKHLNTISIRHVANSIRTHGLGIMNTTVNFTYQFLRSHFQIFSQFLHDEHIKAPLIKEIRLFRDNKHKIDQKYPFHRAEKFNKDIIKLGLAPDGQTYLDQFRGLVSQVGNAIGYVRMIRSGGLHCCSNAIQFIPDLDDVGAFEERCKEAGLSENCKMAARRLDALLETLTKNFSEGTDYLKLLVEAFTPVFRDPKHIHLRNFYIILPALTLNFVEHMVSCKERMNRKNKVGATFTDDGFAMGVAFVLKLLQQYEEFDSLHWFQSVKEKYAKDYSDLQRQRNESGSRVDEKLAQAMALTEKRLKIYSEEFQLLNYSLSSARIFFRSELTAEQKQENETTKEEKPAEQQQQTETTTSIPEPPPLPNLS